MSKISWNDIPEPKAGGNNSDQKSVFATLEVGSNFFRIATNEMHRVMMYWAMGKMIKSADRYGTRQDDRVCPLAKEKDDKGKNYRARPYYLFKAIERSSGEVKVLRVSEQVAQALKEYATSDEWGDLTQYDIKIVRRPKGTNPLYLVQAQPPKPITTEEQALVEGSNIDLEKFARPAKVETIEKFIQERKGKKPAAKTVEQKPKEEVNTTFDGGSNDDDDNFEIDIDLDSV
jgi:hypothetical protein